MIIAFFLIA